MQVDLRLYKQAEQKASKPAVCGCQLDSIYQSLLLAGYARRGELLGELAGAIKKYSESKNPTDWDVACDIAIEAEALIEKA